MIDLYQKGMRWILSLPLLCAFVAFISFCGIKLRRALRMGDLYHATRRNDASNARQAVL